MAQPTATSDTHSGVCKDVLMFWVFAAILFAVPHLLFAPDSRDTRSSIDHYGSWAGLKE